MLLIRCTVRIVAKDKITLGWHSILLCSSFGQCSGLARAIEHVIACVFDYDSGHFIGHEGGSHGIE